MSRKMMIEDNTLTVGKYKGHTVEYIFLDMEDYGYIVWLSNIGEAILPEMLSFSVRQVEDEKITPTFNELNN